MLYFRDDTHIVLIYILHLAQLLQLGQSIAAHVAHGNLGVFGNATRLLGVALAGFLGQGRHRYTNGGTGTARIQPQIGSQDGLLDGCAEVLVVSDDLQGTRIFDSDRSDLIERHVAAPGRDLDAIENARMGTTGTNGSQVAAQRFQGLAHAFLSVFLDVVDHCASSSIRVPSAPPTTTFSRAPGLFMLKTRSGMA